MFDDLADPLGPPTGDALGRVLTRARRRRATQRTAGALIAVVAVVSVAVAVAVAASALDSRSSAVHIAATTTTKPTPTTPPPPSSTTSTTTTTTSTQPVGGGELWSGAQLTITPRSLGRVTVGMTFDQAQTASGVAIDGAADGAFFPTALPSGFPHLFFNEHPSNAVSCVGAELADLATIPQTVSTPEGFRLGGTVHQLLAVYGSRATYSDAPPSGISPRAGYVVTEPGGNLAFDVDPTTSRVYGIKGGGTDLTPSACNG